MRGGSSSTPCRAALPVLAKSHCRTGRIRTSVMLARIADHKISDSAALLPWNWRSAIPVVPDRGSTSSRDNDSPRRRDLWQGRGAAVGHGHGNGAGARKHLRGLERTVTLNGGVSGVDRPVRDFYRTSRYGLVGPILRTSLCASSGPLLPQLLPASRRRCPWLEYRVQLHSVDFVFNRLDNRAKYRGESQNWGQKYDEIINKRRFHKGF
jgi:hypothetical protein